MGSIPAYFTVYPLPAKVPTNAALLVSKHAVGLDMDWTVTVLDGKTPIEVRVDWLASSSGVGGLSAVRPVHGWPPKRSLELVARLSGEEKRHPFETAKSPHETPPTCEWTGPSTIHPKQPTPPMDTWPSNIPRPPTNQRTFSVPQIYSPAGYLVEAQLWVNDRGRTWPVEVGLSAEPAPSPKSGQPAPQVALSGDFSDEAQVIGMTLTDLAGNVSRYGTTG